MAYKIEYSKESSHRYPQQYQKRNIKTGKIWLLLFALAAFLWVRVNGVPDFLIPGDPAVTRSAASAFIDNMQTGMQVGEAVTVFCEQIIDGAGA